MGELIVARERFSDRKEAPAVSELLGERASRSMVIVVDFKNKQMPMDTMLFPIEQLAKAEPETAELPALNDPSIFTNRVSASEEMNGESGDQVAAMYRRRTDAMDYDEYCQVFHYLDSDAAEIVGLCELLRQHEIDDVEQKIVYIGEYCLNLYEHGVSMDIIRTQFHNYYDSIVPGTVEDDTKAHTGTDCTYIITAQNMSTTIKTS